MTNLNPTPGWDAVPQLEETTVAQGGPGGPMNTQAQALLNRTEKLNNDVGSASGAAASAAAAAAAAQSTADAAVVAADLSNTANTAKGAALVGWDGGTLAQFMFSKSNRVVDNVAAIAALDVAKYTRAFSTGFSAAGDGGGGPYQYDPADTTSTPVPGIIIASSTGTGRWKLQFTGNISICQAGVLTSNADNTSAMAALVTWLAVATNTATVPRVIVPSGVFQYATSPNWAIQGLVIQAQVGAIFKHTGSGPVFNADGGATGGGVYRMRVEGGLRLQGNANSTYGMDQRAIHHSYFDFSVRDATTAALRTRWCVCNEYRFAITPVGDPSFIVAPTTGILLDQRAAGEATSACTFYNPIAEGITGGYGINLQNAVQCTFIGGTSESNAGGVAVSSSSKWNRFIGLDMEFNTTADIFCQGPYNVFDNCLSTTASTFSGTANTVMGGNYNSIVSSGVDNEFLKLRYAVAGGTFSDTGTGTIKRSVRNVTSGTLDAELDRNPHQLLYINGPASNNTVIGSADQLVSGGSANDLVHYHYGSGTQQFWVANVKQDTIGANTRGFYGASPVAKPTVSGAKGGNAALGSLISALAALGLITDSTTA